MPNNKKQTQKNEEQRFLCAFGKSRLLVLLGVLILCAVVFFVVSQKTERVYRFLITAPLPVGSNITNMASVTFQDAKGTGYGPVYSAIVTTRVVAPPPPPPATTTFSVKYTIDVRQTYGDQLVIAIVDPVNTQELKRITVTADSAGQKNNIPVGNLTAGNSYNLVMKVPYCLAKKIAVNSWPPAGVLDFGVFLAGNLDAKDNIINSLDWSYMSSKWRTNDVVADLNRDGAVNTVDWSILSKNWFQEGENLL